MQEPTHIGLDVHKESIAVAVPRPGTVECDERVIANTPEALRKLFARYPQRAALRTCYEAGPTGYDTQRLVASLGIDCEVIAPARKDNRLRWWPTPGRPSAACIRPTAGSRPGRARVSPWSPWRASWQALSGGR